MAEADEDYTLTDIPPLVPIGTVLDYLHDADPGALLKPLSYRPYDPATLARLRDQLIAMGGVHGQIDRSPSRRIGPTELQGYDLAYRNFPLPGRALVGVVVAISRQAYPAEAVKDHSTPAPGEGRLYRIVVRNLMIEAAMLRQSPADRPSNG